MTEDKKPPFTVKAITFLVLYFGAFALLQKATKQAALISVAFAYFASTPISKEIIKNFFNKKNE